MAIQTPIDLQTLAVALGSAPTGEGGDRNRQGFGKVNDALALLESWLNDLNDAAATGDENLIDYASLISSGEFKPNLSTGRNYFATINTAVDLVMPDPPPSGRQAFFAVETRLASGGSLSLAGTQGEDWQTDGGGDPNIPTTVDTVIQVVGMWQQTRGLWLLRFVTYLDDTAEPIFVYDIASQTLDNNASNLMPKWSSSSSDALVKTDADGKHIQIQSSSYRAFAFSQLPSDATVFDIVTVQKPTNTINAFRFGVGGRMSDTSPQGYSFITNSPTELRIYRNDTGSFVTQTTAASPFTLASGQVYKIRYRCVTDGGGIRLQVKIVEGAATAEPGSWAIDHAIASPVFANGWIGIVGSGLHMNLYEFRARTDGGVTPWTA